MATVQVLRPFWWNGQVAAKDAALTMSDEDARSLAASGKVTIVTVAPQGLQTAAENPALVPPVAGAPVDSPAAETPAEVKPEAG